MNYGQRFNDIVQETGIKTIHKEKKCKKAKWLSEEALQIAVNRRKAYVTLDINISSGAVSTGPSPFL